MNGNTQAYDTLDDLLLEFPTLSTEVKDCAKEVANGTKLIKDFDAVYEKSASVTSKFASSLKSIAANIGIMLAINLAIKAATAIWDAFNVTVAEVKEKVDELTSSLNSLKSEYEELHSRDYDSLSNSEIRRLNYLERRIELEEELLAAEKRRLQEEKTNKGLTAYFDDDNYNTKYQEQKGLIGNSFSDAFR